MRQLLTNLKSLLNSKSLITILLIISFSFAIYAVNKDYSLNDDIYIKGRVKEAKNNYIIVNNSLIYTNNNYNIDDYIIFKGSYKQIKETRNFNIFDYKKYLKTKKVFNQFIKTKIIKVISKNSIRNRVYNYTNNINDNFLPLILYGQNENVELDTFAQNGVIHLFSISGMHITILTNLLYKILSKKRLKENIIIISLIGFYLYLTNFKIGVLRSFLLLLISMLNNIFNLNINKINIFFIALIITLLINPYLIYSMGFYFSYVLTFFLIMFNNKDDYIISLIKTSAKCFIISIPIMIYNFYYINILSIVYNIIFIPLITILYYISILTLFINNTLIFDHLIDYVNDISIFLNNYSLNIYFIKPHIIIIFIYYFLIYKILSKNRKYIFIFLIMIIIHSNYRTLYKYPELHMIDVNQADSILYTYKNKNILIDTGNKDVIPYLKSLGIYKLDYLVLTHGHSDHALYALDIIANFKVNMVLLNSSSNNTLEQNIIDNINVPYQNISKYKVDNIEFINDVYNNENEDSLITKITVNDYNILLMGDAYVKQEDNINFKVNVLKVGHHGSNTSTSSDFIKRINPDISLISAGNNNYGHPSNEVLNRLDKYYLTKESGTIRLIFKENIEIMKKFQ